MFGKIHVPLFLDPNVLDDYLAKGWFRMGQTIFTCNILRFNKEFYSAIWLRLGLKTYQADRNFKKLKKINVRFDIKIQTATLSQEKEALYSKYKSSVTFDVAESLESLLLNAGEPSIFDTQEVCIYDGNRLIGVGFFDLGEKSAAGIVSFYDPDYKKHSLGKYLIYTKIEYCCQIGLEYFYPGYFTPNYPIFDYKLGIGTAFLEFFDINSKNWMALDQFSSSNIHIDIFRAKISEAEKLFQTFGIPVTRLKYEYYNSNSIEQLKDLDLFDFPEFLFVHIPQKTNFIPVLVYDVLEKKFKVLRCISCYHDENFVGNNQWYGEHLMKIDEEIRSETEAASIVHWFWATMENEIQKIQDLPS